MTDINFFSQDITITLKHRKNLKAFIGKAIKEKGKELGNLNFIFCSDEYLLSINKQYLQHDYYTDIITFEMNSSPVDVSGEIYISIDRVRENAAAVGVSINKELHRVIFHGVLHLCGYKDKLKAEKLAMTEQEDRLLKLYFSKKQ